MSTAELQMAPNVIVSFTRSSGRLLYFGATPAGD
jgi:hypothetical protein